MKTVITLAVAFILGLGVAVTTIGCGGEKKAPAPPAASGDKGATEGDKAKEGDKPAAAPEGDKAKEGDKK